MDHVPFAAPAADASDGVRDRPTRRPVEFPAQLMVGGGKMRDVRVVDLSHDGCQIESPMPLAKDDDILLSVGNRGQIQATVRWFRGGRAGLKFADQQEQPKEVVQRAARRRGHGMQAQLRRIGRLSYSVELRDLSPEGCMIDLVERPSLDEVMHIKLPGLETLQARVRWVDNYIAGLQFERPIHAAVFDLLIERAGH